MSYYDPDEGKAHNDQKLVEIVSGFHNAIGDQVAAIVKERDELREKVHSLALQLDALGG